MRIAEGYDRAAAIAVEHLGSVADTFDSAKSDGAVGGKLEDTKLVRGIVVDKDMAHPQMAKDITDAKLCVLTCPFEPPKPKTKHKLELETVAAYEEMQTAERQYFVDMIEKVKASGANLVI